MAKTYEALLKAKRSSDSRIPRTRQTAKTNIEIPKAERVVKREVLPSSFVSKWQCADLSSTRNIGNLAQWIGPDAKKKVFLFMSNRKGEGTSTVVINLAGFMMDRKSFGDVLLIDANLQHPVLHLAFNVPPSPGLREVLTKEAEYSDVIHRVGASNLNVIPSGAPLSPDSSNIAQKDFSDLISAIHDQYQHILVDSPPLLASSDSLALAMSSDFTALVIQANTTQWEVAEEAKLFLQKNQHL